MINLRYHIVSITAVFLALGIGVALGSTLIERGLVANLNTRLDEQAERLDRTDGENAQLREQLAEDQEFDQRLAEEGTALFSGHLTDVPVVVLTVQGTSDELVDVTRRSLRASGATVAGVLRVTSRWEDLSDEEIAELAEVAGTQSTNPDTVRSLVLRDLADELEDAARIPEVEEPGEGEGEPTDGETVEGAGEGDGEGEIAEGAESTPGDDAGAAEEAALDSPGQADEPGDPDQPADPGDDTGSEDAPEPPPVPDREVVDALLARGYLEFLPDEASSALPAHGLRIVVVVVDGGRDLPDDVVVLPLVEEMGGPTPAPILVSEAHEPDGEGAEGDDADEDGDPAPVGPLIAAIRNDERLAGSVSTVDAPRQFVGQSAIVLGVADLVAEPPRVGHYGLAAGATALLPPVGE